MAKLLKKSYTCIHRQRYLSCQQLYSRTIKIVFFLVLQRNKRRTTSQIASTTVQTKKNEKKKKIKREWKKIRWMFHQHPNYRKEKLKHFEIKRLIVNEIERKIKCASKQIVFICKILRWVSMPYWKAKTQFSLVYS